MFRGINTKVRGIIAKTRGIIVKACGINLEIRGNNAKTRGNNSIQQTKIIISLLKIRHMAGILLLHVELTLKIQRSDLTLVIKELPVPLRLVLTEILLRRLLLGHSIRPKVEKDLAKRRAGHWGEITLANYLKELIPDKYYIFHDLQFCIQGVHFQIDTLLISSNYILIIEAKNISGTLTFDNQFQQLIRLEDDEAFEDPRIQALRNVRLLKRMLHRNGIQVGPIEYLVFFSNVKTKLKAAAGNQSDLSKICKARELFIKIDEFEDKYQKEIFTPGKIQKIGDFLLSQHNPRKINILAEYKLSTEDLRTGVCCPSCFAIPMIYVRGKWICPLCQTTSKNAFIEGINDYFYLYKSTITNSECKKFLHLPSNNIAQKLLFSLNLESTGKTKGRVYHQPIERMLSPCDLR